MVHATNWCSGAGRQRRVYVLRLHGYMWGFCAGPAHHGRMFLLGGADHVCIPHPTLYSHGCRMARGRRASTFLITT
jgi:hypothetical protein